MTVHGLIHTTASLGQAQVSPAELWWVLAGGAGLIVLFFFLFMATRFRRCKPNQILVVYGTIGGTKAARCLHGGGAFVAPLVQDYAYLSLEPHVLTLDMQVPTAEGGAASAMVSLTAQIGTNPAQMENAAERLLGLERAQIEELLREHAERALTALVSEYTTAELELPRSQLRERIRQRVTEELAPLGMDARLELTSFTLFPDAAAASAALRSVP